MISDTERQIIILALYNMALFYAVTVMVFAFAEKTRLNLALATQKTLWLCVILFIALPGYSPTDAYIFIPLAQEFLLPPFLRMCIWVALSIVTWWVLYEVYRVNWNGSVLRFVKTYFQIVADDLRHPFKRRKDRKNDHQSSRDRK